VVAVVAVAQEPGPRGDQAKDVRRARPDALDLPDGTLADPLKARHQLEIEQRVQVRSRGAHGVQGARRVRFDVDDRAQGTVQRGRDVAQLRYPRPEPVRQDRHVAEGARCVEHRVTRVYRAVGAALIADCSARLWEPTAVNVVAAPSSSCRRPGLAVATARTTSSVEVISGQRLLVGVEIAENCVGLFDRGPRRCDRRTERLPCRAQRLPAVVHEGLQSPAGLLVEDVEDLVELDRHHELSRWYIGVVAEHILARPRATLMKRSVYFIVPPSHMISVRPSEAATLHSRCP
jgi:hypothetical protein